MKTIKSIHFYTVALALLLVLALVVAACEGSPEGTTPAGTSTPASDQQQQATTTPAPTISDPESEGETTTETPQESETVIPTAETEEATPAPTPEPRVGIGHPAPELAGIHAWLNSQPLKIGDLRGKVVLVDFWTYTCVNCIRTFPYLREWHAKYADHGLVILGVHTPEFDFEKKLENVDEATKEHDIAWPVALDNDYITWRSFENRYWPAKYLIDKDGILQYTHFGEGAYAETEAKIRSFLQQAGVDLSAVDDTPPEDQAYDSSFPRDRSSRVTRELYAGYLRGYNDALYGLGGYVWNREYYEGQNKVVDYVDPDDHFGDRIFLQGPWHNGPESLRHARETTNYEDYIFLRMSAKSANAVIKPEGPGAGPFKVLVTLDEEYLTDSNKGEDVVIEEDGRSFLYIDEPRLYSIIEAPEYGTYDLKLSSNSSHFALYAFTFGIYESGI